MFDVHCHHCDRIYLVGSRSIRSFHNTSDGPVAYVRCPEGHLLLRHFRHRYSAPVGDAAASPPADAAAVDDELCTVVG